jgi:hypothetical protein
MKEKVKTKVQITHYAALGETGKVTDEWKDRNGFRMRAVNFKEGGYAVFGDKAFDVMLTIVK